MFLLSTGRLRGPACEAATWDRIAEDICHTSDMATLGKRVPITRGHVGSYRPLEDVCHINMATV
ncbi:hypothetical protein SK128_011736, partial [Halocaridina rubra]